MAGTEKMTDEQWLAKVAELEGQGLILKEIAARVGKSPGGLTYKLARLGYKSAPNIVDIRTGQSLAARFRDEEPVAA